MTRTSTVRPTKAETDALADIEAGATWLDAVRDRGGVETARALVPRVGEGMSAQGPDGASALRSAVTLTLGDQIDPRSFVADLHAGDADAHLGWSVILAVTEELQRG